MVNDVYRDTAIEIFENYFARAYKRKENAPMTEKRFVIAIERARKRENRSILNDFRPHARENRSTLNDFRCRQKRKIVQG